MVSQLAQYHMLTNLSFFPLMQNVIFIMLPSLHVQRNNCPVYGLLLQDIYLAALSCKQVWHLNHRAGWKTYDTGGVRGGGVWAGVGGLEWMMEVPRGFSLKSDKKRKAPRSNRENPQEEKHIGKRRKMTRRNAVYRFFLFFSSHALPCWGKRAVWLSFRASDWCLNSAKRLPGGLAQQEE